MRQRNARRPIRGLEGGGSASGQAASGSASGQAIVEYVITLMMALLILSIVTAGFNASLRKTWKRIAYEIAAGCPACPRP